MNHYYWWVMYQLGVMAGCGIGLFVYGVKVRNFWEDAQVFLGGILWIVSTLIFFSLAR